VYDDTLEVLHAAAVWLVQYETQTSIDRADRCLLGGRSPASLGVELAELAKRVAHRLVDSSSEASKGLLVPLPQQQREMLILSL
jgi:hypothetical protein